MITADEIKDILDGKIGEGQKLDFKSEVNLDDKNKKSDLIDDAVAMLNADGGRILIGLREDRKSSTVSLTPVVGDIDSLCLRIQQTLKSNISEQPRNLRVDALAVDGGSVICIEIGKNYIKPYSNGVTGRYLKRNGRQNEPIAPGELQAQFATKTRLIEGVTKLSEDRLFDLKESGFLEADFPYLVLSILPFKHLDADAQSFEPSLGGYSKKQMTGPHGQWKPFLRVFDGYEVSEVDMNGKKIGRFYVGDDWLLQTIKCHPVPYEPGEGRLNLTRFKHEIGGYLEEVARFLKSENLHGPFAIEAAIQNLYAREHFKRIFPRSGSISFGRVSFVDTFDPHTLGESMYQRVFESSYHGGI